MPRKTKYESPRLTPRAYIQVYLARPMNDIEAEAVIKFATMSPDERTRYLGLLESKENQ